MILSYVHLSCDRVFSHVSRPCASAVDAHVGRTIFTDAICGVLRYKTRVLVTHGLQYLTRADRVYVVEGGRIRQVPPTSAAT